MKKGVLQKLTLVIAVLCMLFGLASCGKSVELHFDETAVVEDCVEFTAKNVLVSSQVFPPVCDANPMGWVMDDADKTYVTIVATVKNLTEEELTTEQLWTNFSIYMKDDYVDGSIVALITKNGTKLSDSGSIKAGKTGTVYFITEIAKSDLDESMEAEFDFDGTTLRLNIDGTKPIAVYETLQLKETYTVSGLGKVTPKKLSFMNELEPSNPGYTYDYYAPQTDEDKLLVLTTKAKNTSKKEKAAYRYLNIIAFTGDEVYLGDVVADDAYSANITGNEKIPSGESRQVYAIINLPKSVKLNACDVYVYIDGKYYQYVK